MKIIKDTSPLERWELIQKLRNEKMKWDDIAEKVGVTVRAAMRTFKKKKPFATTTNDGGRMSIFSIEDEAAIKVTCSFFYKCGIALTTTDVMNIAKKYYKSLKGKELECERDTINRLMTRLGFKKGKANRLCQDRFRSYDIEVVNDYVEMMKQALLDAKVAEIIDDIFTITRPELILNIDETSVTTGFTKQPKCWIEIGANKIVECDSDKKREKYHSFGHHNNERRMDRPSTDSSQ